jgi:serine O-acetyltransferase
MNKVEDNINEIMSAIMEDYNSGREIDKMEVYNQPDKEIIIGLIDKLEKILLPGYFKNK